MATVSRKLLGNVINKFENSIVLLVVNIIVTGRLILFLIK